MTTAHPEHYLHIDRSTTPPIIRLKGRRVGIEHVIMPYWSGRSVTELSQDFAVDVVFIQAAVDYAAQHPDEVYAIVDEHRRLGIEGVAHQQAHPSPIVQEMRKRLGRG